MIDYTVIIVTAIIMISLIIIAKLVVNSGKDNKVRFKHNKCSDKKLRSKTSFEIESKNTTKK